MKNETILVIGASGTVGSELVRLLKAEGRQVRTTTSKDSKDPSQVKVNILTGEGLRAAFEGVDKAFFLSPGGYANQYEILSPMIQEAKRRGLKKVVLMTAMGANAVETAPMRRAEIELEKSGLKYNIIRPNWFFQNFNSFWIHGIKTDGVIALPAGDAKTSFIDARDISSVAAKLLTTDKHDNKDFDLSGPEDLTHADVAAALSKGLNKKIAYKDIEPSVLRAGLVGAGLREDYSDFLLMIFGFLKAGYNAGVRSTVKDITGREPRSVRDYVKDYASSF